MHCLACGYNLKALSEPRCPECGRAFSYDDPKSFGSANTHKLLRFARWSGWAAALIAAGVGVASAIPMAMGEHDMIVFIAYCFFALLPFIAACMAHIACRSACGKPPSRRAFVIALLLFAFNASLLTQWPSQASFMLYRNALNSHAQHAAQHPHKHTGANQIGIFPVLETKTNTVEGNRQVILKLNGGNGPDYLVYGMTDAEIEANFNIWSYRRLDADWHIVHED